MMVLLKMMLTLLLKLVASGLRKQTTWCLFIYFCTTTRAITRNGNNEIHTKYTQHQIANNPKWLESFENHIWSLEKTVSWGLEAEKMLSLHYQSLRTAQHHVACRNTWRTWCIESWMLMVSKVGVSIHWVVFESLSENSSKFRSIARLKNISWQQMKPSGRVIKERVVGFGSVLSSKRRTVDYEATSRVQARSENPVCARLSFS